MARRATSNETKKARGTAQPCRSVTTLFEDANSRPDPDIIDPPSWLNKKAKKIFNEKVETYRRRGQKVDGFQAALALYCALEEQILKKFKDGGINNIAAVTRWESMSKSFYDTPSSQKVVIEKQKQSKGRFANARRD